MPDCSRIRLSPDIAYSHSSGVLSLHLPGNLTLDCCKSTYEVHWWLSLKGKCMLMYNDEAFQENTDMCNSKT